MPRDSRPLRDHGANAAPHTLLSGYRTMPDHCRPSPGHRGAAATTGAMTDDSRPAGELDQQNRAPARRIRRCGCRRAEPSFARPHRPGAVSQASGPPASGAEECAVMLPNSCYASNITAPISAYVAPTSAMTGVRTCDRPRLVRAPRRRPPQTGQRAAEQQPCTKPRTWPAGCDAVTEKGGLDRRPQPPRGRES
jgi:hypothetical protein